MKNGRARRDIRFLYVDIRHATRYYAIDDARDDLVRRRYSIMILV